MICVFKERRAASPACRSERDAQYYRAQGLDIGFMDAPDGLSHAITCGND